MSDKGTPSAAHAAIAPNAFSTLCAPGTGSVNRTPPTANVVEAGPNCRFTPRTSHASPKPNTSAPSRRSAGMPSSPHTKRSRVRPFWTRNMAATSSSDLWSLDRFKHTDTAG